MSECTAIAWTDLTVGVKTFLTTNEKIILNNISGNFRFNSINALMGSSGSGKTTLLKCLNASNKYCFSDDSNVWIPKDIEITKCFIYQNHDKRVMTGLTVGQALTYSSKLKNSDKSDVNHKEIVSKVMSELLIGDIGDTPIEKCSGGEVKRLCIALELTALKKPNLLFLDEPTTGLDSNAAEVLIRCLRSLSRTHQMSIITSIHQPNQDLFLMFDSVYVLGRGGVCLYSGLPQNLRQHLTDSSVECNENQIPIEVIIKLSFNGVKDQRIQRLTEKSKNREPIITTYLIKSDRKLNPQFKAFKLIDSWHLLIRFLYRTFVSEFKSLLKTYILFSLMIVIVICLTNEKIGKIGGCAQLNHSTSLSCAELFEEKTILFQNQYFLFLTGSLFIFVIILIHTNGFTADLTSFECEHQNNWYSSGAYWAAKFIVDTLLMLIYATITLVIIQIFREQVYDYYKLGLLFYIISIFYNINKCAGSIFAIMCSNKTKLSVIFAVAFSATLSYYNNFLFRNKFQYQIYQYFNEFNFYLYYMNSILILVYGSGRCPDGEVSTVLIDYHLEEDGTLFRKYMLYFALYYISITMAEMVVFLIKPRIATSNSFVLTLPRIGKLARSDENCSDETVSNPNNDIIHKLNKTMILWTNISYKIPTNRLNGENDLILNNMSGYFEENTINAIMGPSGAGKTTLMKCLNGRLLDGLSGRSKIFVRTGSFRSCFVVQNISERLLEGLTVRQTLLYAFKLKNSQIVGKLDHNMIIDELMAEFLISETANTRVDSCSGGEQKRIVIASELTSYIKPNILLIDEPTSGLDSNAAKVVLSCLRRLSRSHQMSVIASVHQPNQDLFLMFDNIYVLAKGGVAVYLGPPQQLRQHLNDCCVECNENQIPIEVLLKVCSKDTKIESIDDLIEKTNEKNKCLSQKCLNENMRRMYGNPNISKRISFKDFKLLFMRTMVYTFKCQSKSLLVLITYIQLSAILVRHQFDPDMIIPSGCVDIDRLNDCNITLVDIHDNYLIRENIKCIGMSMAITAFVTLFFMTISFGIEYNVFHNEHRNGWYSTGSFLLAKTLVDLMPHIISTAIFCLIINFYNSFEIYLVYYSMNMLILICAQSLAQIGAIISPKNTKVSLLIVVLCQMMIFVLSNIFSPLKDLHYSIQLLSKISYMRYAFECVFLIIYGFNRCNQKQISVILRDFELDDSIFWPNIVKLIILCFIFKFMTLLTFFVKTNYNFVGKRGSDETDLAKHLDSYKLHYLTI